MPTHLPAHAAQQREVERARAVHGRAGLDDEQLAAQVADGLFDPVRMGAAARQQEEVLGGNVESVLQLGGRDRRLRKRAVAGTHRQVLGGPQRPALTGAVFFVLILHG